MARETDDIIGEIADRWAAECRDGFMVMFESANHDQSAWSPIERLMAFGLLFSLQSVELFGGKGGKNEMEFAPNIKPFSDMDFSWTVSYGVMIYPQMRIGKYTADFVVNLKHWRGGSVVGVIECDGHDYHERTKQQAQHDKMRDRYFQSLGLIVLRYTGSEIYKDPVATANGALEILETRANHLTKWGNK